MAQHPQDAVVRVDIPAHASQYEVVVGAGILADLGTRVRASAPNPQALLIVDEAVAHTYGRQVTDSLSEAGIAVAATEVVAVSEQNKVLATWQGLMDRFLAVGLDRQSPVIAVGGGIVSDMAGFAAASYMRGIPFVAVPTTLLAMVDASVGGKTGVNAVMPSSAGSAPVLGKNLIGAFHQPSLVLADVETLASLPDRVFRAGLAECVKHAMLADASLLTWMEQDAPGRYGDTSPGAMVDLVARNVSIKASIVQQDERESFGPRMLLNLGHTFAHVIESQTALGLQHGEAVGLGLIASCATGQALGMTEPGLDLRIERLLTRLGLPTRLADLDDTDILIRKMCGDKKASARRIRIVIPVVPGQAKIVENVQHDVIRVGWERIRAIREE
ncbi:MAG: 3-dehydroquinate synthase [Planctomycetes bacterium]|nr:3-dehydroquinate synthase [Planctomycetota bacterium]NOG53942.1 3-dehydroquinate synthase [Planctomycetota bacterium]